MTTYDEKTQGEACEMPFDETNSQEMMETTPMESDGTVLPTSSNYTEEDDVMNSIAEGYF